MSEMSELSPKNRSTFSPLDMARIAMRNRPDSPTLLQEEAHVQHDQDVKGPHEGGTVELDGQRYQYARVLTGKKVWDGATQQLVPGYYSLRTWFSHHTEGVGIGPGWDGRLNLSSLTNEEMMQQYGHVFTRDEIRSPGGNREYPGGPLSGGMPDDIPYYELVPLRDEALSSEASEEP